MRNGSRSRCGGRRAGRQWVSASPCCREPFREVGTMRRPAQAVIVHGVIGGLLAGFVVALWFLVADTVAGHPFRTPALLAGVLLSHEFSQVTARLVVVYTVLHFGVFPILGVGRAWLSAPFTAPPRLLLAHAQNREDTEMQHRVNYDESGGDLRKLMVQQNAGEQRRRAKGMTCNCIRNEEPERHDEPSEQSTNHAVDDYCLCGSPHGPDLAKRFPTTWRRRQPLSTGATAAASRPRPAPHRGVPAVYSGRPPSSHRLQSSRVAASRRSDLETWTHPPDRPALP